jgi:3alpha(or 20beta)-hydroxysteroid dehydrogenase
MGRVTGKIVIVTGAARGLGAAHAQRLIEEGAKVMLTDVLDKEGKEIARALGGNARYLHHDVTSEAQWQHVVSETENVFGPVSVLVNNAGIVPVMGFLDTLEEADYRSTIDVNQLSVFLGMKCVISSMKRAGGGSIINISSLAGLVGTPFYYAYTASKFAVRGMTKCAAIEFAPFNIRVNSVHPGFIRTALTTNPDIAAATMGAASATPAGHMGEPIDIANTVLMLASEEMRFATGAEFVIDGGYHVSPPPFNLPGI